MNKAKHIFNQNNGDKTKAYYKILYDTSTLGRIAVALMRAAKRSRAAKRYYKPEYKKNAYDVKQWSLTQLVNELKEHADNYNIRWGWKEDKEIKIDGNTAWILYVDIPQGQVSFHSPDRLDGPDYEGDWCGDHCSAQRIIAFCNAIETGKIYDQIKTLHGV